MSKSFKKTMEWEYTYVDKLSSKHHHDYSLKYILEVTNNNPHASCCFKEKVYYNVLKCSFCNSFIPNSTEGNFSGHIFDNDSIDMSLPLIIANTNRKCQAYTFRDLSSVKVEKRG